MLNADEQFKKFESMGETEVRKAIAENRFNPERTRIAREWLSQLEASKTAEADARLEAREEDAISVARDANRISEDANRLAKKAISRSSLANGIAFFAIIISMISMVVSVICGK